MSTLRRVRAFYKVTVTTQVEVPCPEPQQNPYVPPSLRDSARGDEGGSSWIPQDAVRSNNGVPTMSYGSDESSRLIGTRY